MSSFSLKSKNSIEVSPASSVGMVPVNCKQRKKKESVPLAAEVAIRKRKMSLGY